MGMGFASNLVKPHVFLCPGKGVAVNFLEKIRFYFYFWQTYKKNRRGNLKTGYNHRCVWVSIFVCLLTVGWARPAFSQSEQRELPRDIKWVTQSIEYAALCEQTYRAAWRVVKQSASGVTDNWAVVLDVDETVLDNSQYAVERAAVDSGYSRASWNEWVRRKEATLVPGAKAFIDSVRNLHGAHIVYITNRRHYNETPTIENLKKYGLFKEGDLMLTKKGQDDTKVDRRECVKTGTGRCQEAGPLKIVALLGDNIRDFIPMQGRDTAMAYRNNALAHDENWGRTYFMLPNPTYGSWDRNYE